MLYSDAYRVEEHQDNDEPVEPLGLYSVPDPEPKPLFGSPEVCKSPSWSGFTFQKTCCKQTLIRILLDFKVAIDLAMDIKHSKLLISV